MGVRKIQFRGYNLKNKKWLYGYYLVNRGKHYIVQDEVVDPFAEESDFEVDPELVGQYVGNYFNKEIYEGDIVSIKYAYGFFGEKRHTDTGVVVYNPTTVSFGVNINEGESFADLNLYKKANDFSCDDFVCKLIGNEYEEKLKEQQ